jgi:hypothetical protein
MSKPLREVTHKPFTELSDEEKDKAIAKLKEKSGGFAAMD